MMNIRLRSPAVSATVLYASTRAITAGDLWAGADVGVVASTSRALRSGAVPTTLAAAAKRARGCCNARLPNVAVALARATLACCPPLPPPLPVLPAAKEKNGLSPCLAPHRCAGTVVGVMGVGRRVSRAWAVARHTTNPGFFKLMIEIRVKRIADKNTCKANY